MRSKSFAVGVFIVLMFVGFKGSAQVTGGQAAFEYLRLPDAPHVSALGGISVANPDNDIAFALQNPAMMRPGMHNQLQLSYNNYYAAIAIMNLQYGYHDAKLNTSFFFGTQYLNYGGFDQTNSVGNVTGTFHASDYAVTFGASRSYLAHWRYGAAIKWAGSSLAEYKAAAALADVGVNYYDTASLWDVGIVAKNMGVMVKKYDPSNTAEPMPFDLQVGVSKKFKHLPLRLIATVHHLYEWDIRYANPADLTGTNNLGKMDTVKEKGSHFGDKLFRHFILGAELTLAKRLTISASYNDMRRREMALQTDPAMAGFAFGAGLDLKKLQIHYARTYYSVAGAYNEFSLTLMLNKLFGLNQLGEKIHWNAEYPDWE